MVAITSTGDVGRIAVATNADATITWYVYERPHSTGTSLFVQREVSGVFEAEVRLLAEGERPEIFFDDVTSEWIILYVLNENLYLITADENDVPATQAVQTGTTIDHYRTPVVNDTDPLDSPDAVDDRIARRVIHGSAIVDADSTKRINDLTVAASLTPATSLSVRWLAEPSVNTNENLNVAGFNIYRRNISDGSVVRVNSEMVPFKGFVVYEFDVPRVEARYYVTQINYKGDSSSQLIEGRIKPPFDDALTEDVNSIESRMSGRNFGDGLTQTFTITETRPVNVLPSPENFNQNIFGHGLFPEPSVIDYDVIQVISGTTQPIEESFNQSVFGSGLRVFISGSGFGRIVVG